MRVQATGPATPYGDPDQSSLKRRGDIAYLAFDFLLPSPGAAAFMFTQT
jgi:hypothetical protein